MSAAVPIYIYHHTPSGQSRLDRVTQLRTDGVHCQESVVSRHSSRKKGYVVYIKTSMLIVGRTGMLYASPT